MNWKRLITLLLALSMLFVLAACTNNDDGEPSESPENGDLPEESPVAGAEGDLAYVQGNGKMIIGYTIYEPMNYKDEEGNLTGFDTELATLVCAELGVEPEFMIINWGTKEVALAAKDIDCIWNGMTLDPEREANMACTDPYVKNAQVVVVKAGFDYTDTSSLVGMTVCAEIGSAGETMCKGNADTEADPGLAQAEFVGKEVQTDCLMEVKAGTADAAVLDMTLANSMTGEGTNYGDLEIVDYLGEENYGVAFRQGSDIRDAVNEIFEAMRADGSLQTLAEKYGLELAD